MRSMYHEHVRCVVLILFVACAAPPPSSPSVDVARPSMPPWSCRTPSRAIRRMHPTRTRKIADIYFAQQKWPEARAGYEKWIHDHRSEQADIDSARKRLESIP